MITYFIKSIKFTSILAVFFCAVVCSLFILDKDSISIFYIAILLILSMMLSDLFAIKDEFLFDYQYWFLSIKNNVTKYFLFLANAILNYKFLLFIIISISIGLKTHHITPTFMIEIMWLFVYLTYSIFSSFIFHFVYRKTIVMVCFKMLIAIISVLLIYLNQKKAAILVPYFPINYYWVLSSFILLFFLIIGGYFIFQQKIKQNVFQDVLVRQKLKLKQFSFF